MIYQRRVYCDSCGSPADAALDLVMILCWQTCPCHICNWCAKTEEVVPHKSPRPLHSCKDSAIASATL